jgi:predicted nucleic acid-binding protein
VRLFCDANVLFTAAHNTGGRSAALGNLASHGRCQLTASPHAVEEARRNLEIKYPHAIPRLEELLRVVTVCAECPPEKAEWARAHSLPDKDAPILGAAAHCRADLLVTGDRTHFGHLYGKSLGGVLIVTPAEALRLVMAD